MKEPWVYRNGALKRERDIPFGADVVSIGPKHHCGVHGSDIVSLQLSTRHVCSRGPISADCIRVRWTTLWELVCDPTVPFAILDDAFADQWPHKGESTNYPPLEESK